MAMTYQNFASLGVNLNRQKYGPLDISNVFTSAADLKYYLTKGTFTEGVSEYWYKNADEKIVPYPYEGQVLATVIDGVVEVFVLALDAEGNFETREIAGKIEVDGKTIVKDAEGKLSIVAPVDPDEKKTYNFAYANGVYSWVEVDTATAAGQAQAIQGLTDRTVALETVVGNAESGLVKGIADNKKAIEDEAAARAAADSALETKITEALQAAKDYADANDANTVYDDTALASRVSAIEADYLKEADKYDDSALNSRVTAVESTVGNAEGGLVKAVADNTQAIADEKTRAEAAEKTLGERIDAIDFVDPDELETAVAAGVTEAKGYTDAEIDKIEAAIAALNHFTSKVVTSVDDVKDTGVLYLIKNESVAGVDKYDEYIVIEGVATLIGDTTTDLSNYYNKTEIDGKVETINNAIGAEVEAREALAEEVEALKAIDNATQAELETYKAEVTAAIATAKSEAISDADGKLATKVDSSDFETFKGENTTAIGAAKDAAIAAAKSETETQVGALKTEVVRDYATKAELSAHESEIENELLAYAKTADVNAELAKKVESGAIAHTSTGVVEGVTVEGTKLNIVVDAYTKEETLAKIDEKITSFTGGESAKDVLNALNTYKETNNAKVSALEAKDETHDTAIAKAQEDATKGIGDAAKVAGDLATLGITVADNTREIGVAKSSIETVNTTLTEKITALENKDAATDSTIAALQNVVTGESGHAARITALEGRATNLETRDTELATLIQGNTDKFAGYYTKGEVDTKVQEAIDAIPDVDFTPYAKTEYVNAELATKADASAVYTKDEADAAFMNQDEVDARINALIAAADPENGKVITDIQNLVKYVDENAGEIAGLVTTVGEHTTTISQHTTKLSEIDAALAAIVQPKASTEISVGTDGTLGINEMNVNKLVQTAGDTLVLNGGNAEVKATE